MADNTRLPIGTEDGDTYASDDIAGVKWQRVKVCFGVDGSATDCSASAPLPVDNAALSVVGEGAKATALRVALANDMTSVVKTDGSATTQPVSGTVSVAGTVPVSIAAAGPATGTKANVSDTNSSVTILAANAARLGALVWNDSTAILYLDLSGGTASPTSASLALQPGSVFELQIGRNGLPYTGLITGIWSADASGAARVTEFTA